MSGPAVPLVSVSEGDDSVVSVHALSSGTCAVLRSNAIKCWGMQGPELGQPALIAALGNIGDEPGEMLALTAINLGGRGAIRSFDSGARHSCALFESGEIVCWGANDSGQLGVGHKDAIGDDEVEMGGALQATRVR